MGASTPYLILIWGFHTPKKTRHLVEIPQDRKGIPGILHIFDLSEERVLHLEPLVRPYGKRREPILECRKRKRKDGIVSVRKTLRKA